MKLNAGQKQRLTNEQAHDQENRSTEFAVLESIGSSIKVKYNVPVCDWAYNLDEYKINLEYHINLDSNTITYCSEKHTTTGKKVINLTAREATLFNKDGELIDSEEISPECY